MRENLPRQKGRKLLEKDFSLTKSNTYCVLSVTVALFTTGKKVWMQAKGPSTGEWIQNVMYRHNVPLLLFKKVGNSDTCYNTDEI